jgi:hypothetical protein
MTAADELVGLLRARAAGPERRVDARSLVGDDEDQLPR